MKYGRLSVVPNSEYLKEIGTKGKRATYIRAICECGKIKNYLLSHIKTGHTKSCGCYNKQLITNHGLIDHQLYPIWNNIIQRCENHRSKDFHNYGARGITICDEWRNNIKDFIDWALANGWQKGLQIDRIDNNGNYSPNNCRFVTCSMNARNKRGYGSSKFKGVSWNKSRSKWKSSVKIEGKTKNLGLYSDEIQAAKAYNDATIKYFPNNPELLNEV